MMQLFLAVVLANLSKILSHESYQEMQVKKKRVMEDRKHQLEEQSDSDVEAWEESLGNELSILKPEPKPKRSPFPLLGIGSPAGAETKLAAGSPARG